MAADKTEFNTPLLQGLAYDYLEHTVRGNGWMKGETHDKLCHYISHYLQVDENANHRLIYVVMREFLTDSLTETIGLKWNFVTKRELKTYTRKFIEKLKELLPFVSKHAVQDAETDEWWILRDKEILTLCDELKTMKEQSDGR